MRHRWREGCHFGVLCCAVAAGTTLLVNVILTVVVDTKYEVSDGVATIQDGDCNKTKRLDLWLHLLINALSTLLLGASNYSMQCLSAPTRKDLDAAHRQDEWMDIGVLSVRNVLRISWPRRFLWCLLLMSSVPLHLMYNSVVFASTSFSDWHAFAVTSDFLTGAPYNISSVLTRYQEYEPFDLRVERLQNSTSLIRLELDACLAAYNKIIVSYWGDVLVITTWPSSKNSLLWVMEGGKGPESGDAGFCNSFTDDDFTRCVNNGSPEPDEWTSEFSPYPKSSGKVSYCMAEKALQHCKIRFSVSFMIAVIVCNGIKVMCMGIIVWKLDPHPLVTIGDAISSFLDSPDVTTVGNCLSQESRFKNTLSWAVCPSQYHRQRYRWFASASLNRWLTTTTLCVLTLGAAIGLLILGVVDLDMSNPFSLGFGAVSTHTTIARQNMNGEIVPSILLANSPQLLLSFLYFAYNGLWTSMLLAQEWSGYATHRKALRVTSPAGSQRSTYRLQLPYRYGIPLLLISGTLHWLVSQSIFLIILDDYSFDGSPSTDTTYNRALCGYSPVAILTAIITGLFVLVLGIANGFRRYPSTGIPLVGSCSAVISAACHPPAGDEQASTKPVMWGACTRREDRSWEERVTDRGRGASFGEGKEAWRQRREDRGKMADVGHCSFTSLRVEEPVEGEVYTGLKNRRDKGCSTSVVQSSRG